MKRNALWLAVVGVALVAGCEGETETAPVVPNAVPPAPAAPAVPPAARVEGEGVAVPVEVNVEPAAAAANEAAGEAVKTAESKLQQVMTYIKENKYDLADKTLKELEGMKAQLPAAWGPRIEQARQTLAGARTADGLRNGEGIKVPQIPGMSK